MFEILIISSIRAMSHSWIFLKISGFQQQLEVCYCHTYLAAGFEWQPAVSRRGRNIRTARHKYADDIELSSDEDWAANGAAKRPKRASRQLSLAENTNGVYPPHNKADSTTIGKMPNSRASSQVRLRPNHLACVFHLDNCCKFPSTD